MRDSRFKAFLHRWFAPVSTKEAMIRRYRAIAIREALIAVAMLLTYFSVPLWAAESLVPDLTALLLAATGMFAALAAATLWAAALIKRDLY